MFENWYTRDYLALIAIIISVTTGIIVPFFKYLYHRINSKPILECFLTESATAFFDSTVGFWLTMTVISKKCDSVIKKIEIEIFKGDTRESKIYKMKWVLLTSMNRKTTYSDWGISSTDRESMTPCPIYLTKNNPVSYSVHFEDDAATKAIQEMASNVIDMNYVKDTLLTKMGYVEGNHIVDVIITDMDDSKKRFPHSFVMSKRDVDGLKYNATIVCENTKKEKHERTPTNSANVEISKL